MNEFQMLRELAARDGPPGLRARRDALKSLEAVISSRKEEMVQALVEDFGRHSREEVLLLEIFPILNAIHYALDHVEGWMRPRNINVGLLFKPAKARIIPQPAGVVGIIAAWNYPFFLSFMPLVDALAAGNRVLIKPSELAPKAAELVGNIVSEAFPDTSVQVVNGGPEVARQFAALPFDHLLFTGSTRVGKLIMKAAADNLTPVTLELGGKSPAIIQDRYPLWRAAERIWTGKLYKAGQTCLAPDYVLVPESRVDGFVEVSRQVIARLYPTLEGNPDYTAIINRHHYERLMNLLADAMTQGAECLPFHNPGEKPDADSRIMAPVVVLRPTGQMAVMQEEIFGPILPVVPYSTLDEAIAYVNARPRPLALYYFDHNRKRIDRVLRETVSGGVTVNDVILHVAQCGLPFGGIGPSGMGQYHGETGFRRFSHEKGILLQSRRPSTALLRPPFGRMAKFLARFLLK